MSELRQARTSPLYAQRVVEALWPRAAVRNSILNLLADSIRYADSQGSAAWELSLFNDHIRFNVGQVAVLDLWAQNVSLLAGCMSRMVDLPLPRGMGISNGWLGYAAVQIPTIHYLVEPEAVKKIPDWACSDHRRLIAEAARRKRVSPWKTAHSPGLLIYMAQVLGESLPQPSYTTPPQESPKQLEQMAIVNGGGFGDSEGNRRVEAFAIQMVTEWYLAQGWSVTSVEAQNKGFDLLCQKGRVVRHVEVKGLSGVGSQVILTANEFESAFQDELFFLALVRNATSERPELRQWSAKQFRQSFSFSPIQYWARLQDTLDR